MIENLLLDPVATWHLLMAHRERLSLASEEDVAAEFHRLAVGFREDEIRMRVLSGYQPIVLRIEATNVDAVPALRDDLHGKLNDELEVIGGEESIRQKVDEAATAVDAILAEGTELLFFRGKPILRQFFATHVQQLGFGYQGFVYQLGQRVRESHRIQELTADAVLRIQRFVPAGLVSGLEAAAKAFEGELQVEARALCDMACSARSAWENGVDDDMDHEALRGRVVRLAREARTHGLPDLNAQLLRASVQLGTG